MKYLSIGAQELSEFKKYDYIYVDKTELIYKLITTGRYYFLSRPRRFGKSLLVGTLKEIFSGNKELFKGMWIENKWDFEEHLVLHLDFTKLSYKEQGLKKALDIFLDETAIKHKINYFQPDYSGKFLELIEKLGKEKQVAILIDEYDKPIIDYLENNKLEQAEENREILKTFYSGIKAQDGFIRFLFITGVSKFSKVSIFSDLNNLEDITMAKDYSQLLGYTEKEIIKYYKNYLNDLNNEFGFSENETMEKIKKWYDGYSWDGKYFVYNPFSILNLLKSRSFENFWFETGTPTFLIKKIKENKTDFSKINGNGRKISDAAFNKYDIENINATALMFQTGYLTIKEYDVKKNKYLLDFPNKEVKDSFLNFAINSYSNRDQAETETIVDNLIDYLEQNKIAEFIIELKSLFSSITVKELEKVKSYEGYYHSIIYIVLKIIGISILCEVQSNLGITDAVIKTKKYIYIFEFKMGKAEEAIKQIKDKKYFEPYLSDKRKIILLGIGFDKERRNINDFISEKLEEKA